MIKTVEKQKENEAGIKGYKAEAVKTLESVLQLEQLNVYVQKGRQRHTLVHDLSLSICPGETLALVGESGSGKSVTASAVMGLLPSTLGIGGGRIVFQGKDILLWPEEMKRRLRGKEIGFVFQDYQGSFTPFIKVGKQLVETIQTHQGLSYKEARSMAMEWLCYVDLPAERVFDSYPFQLSGGQLQRAALAAAMLLKPALLIADEPTTALDVLTGELVLNLLAKLQQQTGCAVLLISHDLRHVMKRADTIAVMQHGRIVEMESSERMRSQAQHPYTQMLLNARPMLTEIPTGFTVDRKTDGTSQPVIPMGGVWA